MAHRDIIVIGASAGGVEAISQLVSQLPGDLPAALFVTLHFPRFSESLLPRILNRAGSLVAEHARDGEPIRHGRIYVAPPDLHLLIVPGAVRLARGPTENGHRPAVDPMFRSAAVAYGSRVIGVVLTGNLDDGTAGLLAVTRRGGVSVVQDPGEAVFPSMPLSVVEHGLAQHVLPLSDIGGELQRLVDEEITTGPEANVPDEDARRETRYSAFDLQAIENPADHPGEPSPYSCPDCGGVLWSLQDGDLQRFRCRVGHGWTSDALLLEQTETLDTALWTALRALEETAALNTQMAQRMLSRGRSSLADRFTAMARVAERRAAVVREVLATESREEVTPDAAEFPTGALERVAAGHGLRAGPEESGEEARK